MPVFVEALATFGEVHGPQSTDDGVTVFDRLASPSELRLDYRRTLLPPKKYLLPPRETILAYSPESGYREPAATKKNIVLFGVHPCDLAGIVYLDRVFLGDAPDPLYRRRREGLMLIGISCEPDEFCFCGDTGSEQPTPFDIFLHRTDDGYRLDPGSPRGEEIMANLSHLFEKKEIPATRTKACSPFKEAIERAVEAGETFDESPLWDYFATRCLSCGACSICCPTCYCFDVLEYGGLDGETAHRLREWDNCLFKEHGKVAGGHNFRKTRQERFRYRFRHKYLGFGPVRGITSCVGCGRCREVCPVGIDLLELFRARMKVEGWGKA